MSEAKNPPPAAASSETPAPAAGGDKPLTLRQKIDAFIAEKASLVSARDTALARVDELDAEVALLTAQLATANAEVKAAKSAQDKAATEAAAAAAAQKKAETENKTVAETVAGMGFPPEKTPAATGDLPATKADLLNQFRAETDLKKRAVIYAKLCKN